MVFVSAHDLTTGAGFVLPAHVRCVGATALLRSREEGSKLHRSVIDETAIRTLGSYPPGSIVYAEWKGPQSSHWLKLRVLTSPPRP